MNTLILHYTGDLEGLGVAVYPDRTTAVGQWLAERDQSRYGFVISEPKDILDNALTVPEDEPEPRRRLTGAGLAKVWNEFADTEVPGRFTNRDSAAVKVGRMLLERFGKDDVVMTDSEAGTSFTTVQTIPLGIEEIETHSNDAADAAGTAAMAREVPAPPSSVPVPYEETVRAVMANVAEEMRLPVNRLIGIGGPSNAVEPPPPPTKKPRGFSLAAVGIAPGAVLVSKLDPAMTCTVIDDRRVAMEESEYSLSKAALIVARRTGRMWPTIQGTAYWLFQGKRLVDLAAGA